MRNLLAAAFLSAIGFSSLMAHDLMGTDSGMEVQSGFTHTFQVAPSAFSNAQSGSARNIDAQTLDLRARKSVSYRLDMDNSMEAVPLAMAPAGKAGDDTYTEVQMGEMTYTNLVYFPSTGEVRLNYSNADYVGSFSLLVGSEIAGTYTINDVYAPLNSLGFNSLVGPEGRVDMTDLEVAILTGSRETDGYDFRVNANIYSYDGYKYVTTFDYNYPYAASTVDFVATNLRVDDSTMDLYWSILGYGFFEFRASNDDYTLSGAVMSDTCLIEGTYEIMPGNKLTITNMYDGTIATSYSGEYTITKNDDGKYAINGKVLFSNNVEYILNLSDAEQKEPTRYETITVSDARYMDFFYANTYDLYGDSDDQKYTIYFPINSNQVAGHYTKADLAFVDMGLSYIASIDEDGNITKRYDEYISADIDITPNEDGFTYTVSAVILAHNRKNVDTDYPMFTINMVIKGLYYDALSDYQEQFDLNETSFEKVDVTVGGEPLDTDAYIVEATSDNGAIASFLFFSNGGLLPGAYGINGSMADKTVLASTGLAVDGSINLSFAGYLEDEYISVPLWFITKGTVVVDADGSISVDAYNSCGYPISIRIQSNATAIQNVNAPQHTDGKYIKDGKLYIHYAGQLYDAQGILY